MEDDPTLSLDAETFHDTHISPESIGSHRPLSSNVLEYQKQPSAKYQDVEVMFSYFHVLINRFRLKCPK